jgi:hypothetical protein
MHEDEILATKAASQGLGVVAIPSSVPETVMMLKIATMILAMWCSAAIVAFGCWVLDMIRITDDDFY